MRKNLPKSSNLDLRLLDCKFIAIDDNQTYITEVMQSVRRSKISQLPSLIKSHQYNSKHYSNLNTTTSYNKPNAKSYFCQESTSNDTFLMDHSVNDQILKNQQNTNALNQTEDIENQLTEKDSTATFMKEDSENPSQTKNKLQDAIRSKHNMKRNKSLPSFQQPLYAKTSAQKQLAQLQKYRKKIARIKKQNCLVHEQISSLYRNKINQRQEPLKKVRKIQIFSSIQNMKKEDSVFAQTPKQEQNFLKAKANIIKLQKIEKKRQADLQKIESVRKSLNFYEELNDQTPYKAQIQKLHKKMISSNLNKNFEQYLLSQSKRVPQFLKRIRT